MTGSKERTVRPLSGFVALPLVLAVAAFAVWAIRTGARHQSGWWIFLGVVSLLLFLLLLAGFFVVNPNDSRVLVLFGRYVGSVRENGFFYVNPFTVKHKVTLRAQTLNGEKLKVNDRAGNPIEIAAVVVWRVRDTYAAKFEVEDYHEYVATQSEAAVRKLAALYHYDAPEEEEEVTLRGDTETINEKLVHELEERFGRAGIEVLEARITHLAYAPEIAQAMLQRQQAQAVVAARTKIVEGAVGMVEMALEELSRRRVLELDDERRAAMVSNLLTVLASERTTPVINTGTLYT